VTATSWKVHKFGGSSLADASCFERVAQILIEARAEGDDPNLGVIVSAMGGMTDSLLDLTVVAERDDKGFTGKLQAIGDRYAGTAKALVHEDRLIAILDSWSVDATVIQEILIGIASAKSAPQRVRDVIAGYGEIWSARLLAAHLEERLGAGQAGMWIDARDILIVRPGELGPIVLWDLSQRNLQQQIEPGFSGIAVVTGFIAADEQGLQMTLGRNGSDHSAAIFAALWKADSLTIWTDVDGVLSGDPRRVPEAQIINALTYNEAMELAYFGASVIHPQTMGPAVANDIPVFIKNTFFPQRRGSRISSDSESDRSIKGVTAVDGMALVNLEGAGMIGVPGTADRLFAALRDAGVSVTLISQASSEHSICIAVPEVLARRAQAVIREAFAVELEDGQIQSVDVTEAQSIIAVVGDNMAGHPGIAARFFGTLGRAGINIRAIAQGSSERNISVVVKSADATRALRAVHSGFYLSAKTLSLGLIGPGTVGSQLLEQIKDRRDWLLENRNLDLRIRAIGRSQSMLLDDRRIALDDWCHLFDQDGVPMDVEAFVNHVQADHLPHAAIIDCSSSDDIAGRYGDWLGRGIHVVTPNKKAFSGSQKAFQEIHKKAGQGNSHYFYETTVGAALPIISTLRNLIDTGDEVHEIQGILSGTLAYLFNVYDGSTPFSEIVREARDSGYTEPDPRDDLSGMDVARKLVILARELGQDIEIGEFPVESLIPAPLRDVGAADFMEALPQYDEQVKVRFEEAKSAGKVLRYVATLNSAGEASVALKKISPDNAMAHINLTDNIVKFTTQRYAKNPLVIQGPGAGPAITAGGIFADVLSLANLLEGTD
jgi:aspartokinase/homoserine dehydrogenase 1